MTRGGGPRAARHLRAGVLALIGLFMLLAPAGPAAATAEVGPVTQAPPVAEGVPEKVAQWFRTEAADVVSTQGGAELDLSAEQRGAVEIGLVRTVSTWSAGFRAGGEADPPLEVTSRWVAPLSLGPEGVGVLVAGLDTNGVVGAEQLRSAPDLADALLALGPAQPVVHDVPLDAWFTVAAGEVLPLDDAARASLAGAVALDVYRPFVQERYAVADPNQPGSALPDAHSWAPAAWVAAALLLLLGWAGLVVWLRREGDGADVRETRPARPRTRPRSRGAQR
ncbi:hypothetical protein KZX45_05135 [Georgenia sp. EYE_87]|uniref:hypothetical protein n=1 Tax=Georgenia sp. EYE_87 TaxID=2853448 RepID=UPI0020046789|nr:hypothetical protein [Georgenia sp. EYE_87]MCK6209922.1 hypothetical protein [Georgenia sp. EYE_87]